MGITSYHKSLWVRNIVLVLTLAALAGAVWKIGASVGKIAAYDQARAYYDAGNLILAEQTFSKASAYSGIRYGDEAWEAFMAELTASRQQLESLSQQMQTAAGDGQEEQMLQLYERYQSWKQESVRQGGQSASFFQTISERLGMEKALHSYFQSAIQLSKAHIDANTSGKSYENESFIHTLAIIPAEFFGGKEVKQKELHSLFQRYETAKLGALASSSPFADVVARTAAGIRLYKQEGIASDWLQDLLERYALGEVRQAIRQKDLPAFVTMAKAYREIKDVLPGDSGVLAAIDDHVKSRIEQAENYAKARQFSKAIELYQGLGELLDTSQLIAGVEELWTEYVPARMLTAKYPDKTFQSVLTGTDRWGAKVYALGVEKNEHRLVAAAKLEGESAPVYMEKALDTGGDVRISLTDLQDDDKNPVLLVQGQGSKRAFTYIGLVPDWSGASLNERFAIEADDLAVEDAARVVIKNAVGDGENEIALFQFEDSGLKYEERLAELQTETEEPESPGVDQDDGSADETDQPPTLADVYAGPGETYEIIGQISLDGTFDVVTELNGWYQIRFNGKEEGWIQAPRP